MGPDTYSALTASGSTSEATEGQFDSNSYSSEERDRALSRVYLKIAEAWSLNQYEIDSLAGVDSSPGAAHGGFRQNQSLDDEQAERLRCVIAIFSGLESFFGVESAFSRGWVTSENSDALFGKKTPLSLMIEGGLEKIKEVRGYVDGLAFGL